MSQTQQSKDDTVVERFKEGISSVVRADDHPDYERQINGKGWVGRKIKYRGRSVFLFGDDVMEYGIVEFDEYTDAEYVETRSSDNHSCYGFDAGEWTHWVDVNIVRTLANDVFDVSYDEIQSWAKTNKTDSNTDGPFEGDMPVLFDVPDSEYQVMVAPIVGVDG